MRDTDFIDVFQLFIVWWLNQSCLAELIADIHIRIFCLVTFVSPTVQSQVLIESWAAAFEYPFDAKKEKREVYIQFPALKVSIFGLLNGIVIEKNKSTNKQTKSIIQNNVTKQQKTTQNFVKTY